MFQSVKLLAVGLAMGFVTLASASSFIAISVGTYSTFIPFYTTKETVVGSFTAPYASLSTLDFFALYGGAGIGAGLAKYTAVNGDELLLKFNGGPFTFDPSANVASVSGAWAFVSGTGSYASVANGSGSWSASYNAPLGQLAQTTFVGQLNPVPEPASLAGLAVGIGALAARRRRKSA